MPRASTRRLSLTEAHVLGRKLLKEMPGRGEYGDNALNKLAEEFGLPKHQTWVFRRFADPDTGYTPQELQELLALCRKRDYELKSSFIEL